MLDARSSLEKGSTLTEPLKKSWIFPPMVTSMTEIGESTGSLDYMLEKIADFYEEEVDRSVDTLKSLIEPLMILILAGAVGMINQTTTEYMKKQKEHKKVAPLKQ